MEAKANILKGINNARILYNSNLLGHFFLYVATLIMYLISHFLLMIIFGRERKNRILLRYEIYNMTDYYLWALRLLGVKDNRLPPVLVADLYHDERSVRKYIRNRVKGELLVDVGAGVGLYTLDLRNNFKRVLAIEPCPNNVAILAEAVDRQKAQNIICLAMAVSNEEGTDRLYLGPHWGWHTLIPRYSRSISVKTVTLSKLLENERAIDFVKVDVEGAEWKVLEGSIPILDKVKSWLIELHNPDKKAEMSKWFTSRGFKVKWLDHSHVYAERA